MAPTCGICHIEESKYKCPICELRYCSLSCYTSHKTTHSEQQGQNNDATATTQLKKDRPGTTQRVPKLDFTGFETDKELLRLLKRYPLLNIQLQTVYGLTLEPGPEEARTWNKQPLPSLPSYDSPEPLPNRSRARGRGGRGDRGGRGRRGWSRYDDSTHEEREHGRWTQEKGDREAMKMIAKMRDGNGNWRVEDDAAEGMREFVELLKMRFGGDRDVERSAE